MAVLGTFGSFGIARLAIYASSAKLNVTGNNIANINTDGYTRQYVSTSPMYTAGVDQLSSGGSLNFGAGVSPDAIYQYRDIYMDIRYRDASTQVGEESTKLSALQDVANILDEVASGEADFGIIEAQFSEIVEMLQNLSNYTGSEEYDTLVRSACETLVQLFNSYANQLDTVEENQMENYLADIDSTNLLLTNIRDLNEQIRNAGIYGDAALVLRDQRNLLVDELSTYMGIDVTYSEEDIGMGVLVENMTITIAGTDTELVNGVYCTQLTMDEYVPMPNPYIDDNGNAYFDSSSASSYMYTDLDGNPTNDASLAAAWLNPHYPDHSESAWLNANGYPVNDVRLAGPAPNESYFAYKAADEWNSVAVDGVYGNYPIDPPLTVVYNAEPMNEDGGWMGGEFGVGLWDETLNDGAGGWVKNDDGSYYVAYTTNDANHTGTSYTVYNPDYDPDYDRDADTTDLTALTDDEKEEYYAKFESPYLLVEDASLSVIQMNNNVQGTDMDNTYLITLEAMTDAKGVYMKDINFRDITTDIVLGDTVLSGALQAHREMLTGEGEFSSMLEIAMNSEATSTRGIPYYQKTLDSLAQKFAETFNTLNVLNPDDIFAVNDKGEFYDKSKPLYDPAVDYSADPVVIPDGAILQLDAEGNPMYEVLQVTIGTGVGNDTTSVIVTTDNMYDVNPLTGLTIYEEFIYTEGVRDPNFLTDSDGNYLQEVERGGELYYEPIQALDDDGNLLVDINGNPIYITAKNLTSENYTVLLEGYDTEERAVVYEDGTPYMEPLMDAAGNYVDESGNILGVFVNDVWVGAGAPDDIVMKEVFQTSGTEGAITQEIYNPAEMYNYVEDPDDPDGGYFTDKNGNPITMEVPDTSPGAEEGDMVTVNITYKMAMENVEAWDVLQDQGVLTDEYQNLLKAGNLFSTSSNNNDATGITASNISISRDWSIGEVRIVLAKGEDPGSTDNSNVIKFITAMDASMQYDARDVAADAWTGKNEYYKGSFQGQLTNTASVLAQDMQTTTTLLVNYESTALSLDNNRMSVSGVDLNEEATNMMQYQKAYVAAAKLMTTLDEVLEVLLNM